MVTCWEIDAHPVYDMFSLYNYEVQSESSRTVLVVLFVFNEESQNFAY